MLVLQETVVVKVGVSFEVSGQPDLDGRVLDVIRKDSVGASGKGRILGVCADRSCPGIRGARFPKSIGVSVRSMGVSDNEKKARGRGRDIPGGT
jgi:hypothetical protein